MEPTWCADLGARWMHRRASNPEHEMSRAARQDPPAPPAPRCRMRAAIFAGWRVLVDVGESGCAPSVVHESRRPLAMSPFGAMVIARTRARRCGRLPGCWAPRSPGEHDSRMLGSGPDGWTTVPQSGLSDLANRRISPISSALTAILEWRGAERTLTLQRLPAPLAMTAADPHWRILAEVPLEPHATRMGVAEIRRGAPKQGSSAPLDFRTLGPARRRSARAPK